MDDTCVICAESLEWVAYGACGHREVCSTCVVRMRFVLEDSRCCLCKVESSTVFITKALGDYTRVITDFSQFPSGALEGQIGNYWYHEDTQAYFDDKDHYQMIKAMCRLSCSECDRIGEQSDGSAKRRSRFRNIDQLKSHLYHRHKLFMCTLCLEGRKIFICEQKLYTKAQLIRHINGGDPEVDGAESERGGFKGHPLCEFCRTPFYGDNELYTHMSTEHYTCHICQRQHPGQYDYFKNYDDLETHFRQEHYLCESEGCLAKKFIVFPSESELKRHNAVEHGGNMSRSKRNAALQIPTSFRYRRATEHDQRRGRGHGHGPRHESSDHHLAMAIQASLDSSTSSNTNQTESPPALPPERAPPFRPINGSSSTSSPLPLIEDSFPPLSDQDPPETSSKYAKALVQRSTGPSRLGGEAFPPLPGAPEAARIKPAAPPGKATIAAHLRHQSKAAVAVLRHRPAPLSHDPQPSMPMSSPQLWPTPAQEFKPSNPSSSRSSSQTRSTVSDSSWSSYSLSAKKPANKKDTPLSIHQISSGSGGTVSNVSGGGGGGGSGSQGGGASSVGVGRGGGAGGVGTGSGVAGGSKGGRGLTHSSSAPDLRVAEDDDIQAANKALVERIRTDLGMDEEKFSAFKHISSEYRQGLTDTWEYLSYVEQFGLLHLVPELARLCPDPQKQRELLGSYSVKQQSGSSSWKPQSKGKGKSVAVPRPSAAGVDSLSDGILEAVKKLQSNYKQEEEVEELSKDGYRATNTKSKPPPLQTPMPPVVVAIGDEDYNKTRQRPKKVSKFQRVRLGGDGLVIPEAVEEEPAAPVGVEGIPVSGVWRRGGGQKLFPSAGGRTR